MGSVERSALSTPVGTAALVELIRAEINSHGPVSFAWFMQQALYHPELGYYSSGRAAIGRHGDFFTNVSVGPLFGTLMAAQFVQIWKLLGQRQDFTVAEQGAHDGRFARDVLESAAATAPEFLHAIRYRIIESFPVWRQRQMEILQGGTRDRSSAAIGPDFSPKVEWRNELEPFSGIHFSNELLDAMPVNLCGKAVGIADHGFALVDVTYEMPPNESQLAWIDRIAVNLRRGVIIIADYGFCGRQLQETVQARIRHRKLDSVFEQIGQADITLHVNWTAIARRAEVKGLRILGFTDQHHFLTGIISDFPELVADHASGRALQTLLHPEILGRAFQVLVLGKDLDSAISLSGLKYARDPRAALAL